MKFIFGFCVFEFRLGHQLTFMRFLVDFLSPCRQIAGYRLIFSHDRLLQYHFQLDIHHHSFILSMLCILITRSILHNYITASLSLQRTTTSDTVYRVSPGGECARLQENVPYVKVHRYNPKHLYPKLNGYGDNGERKVWSSCGSTYCTFFVCCYPYTARVRPSVSQPSQAHSDFIINRCHSYSEL